MPICNDCEPSTGSPAGSNSANDCLPCTDLVQGAKHCDTASPSVPTKCLEGWVMLEIPFNPIICVQCVVPNCEVCSYAGHANDCITCKSGYSLTSKIGDFSATCTKICNLGNIDRCI